MAATQRHGFKDGNGPGNGKGEGKGDLTGTEFADHIMGTTGNDVVDAGAGHDVIIGFAGDDVLEGGAGHDDISGGAGNDILVGGAWDSTLNGDAVVDGGGWVLTYDDVDNTLDVWTYQGSEVTGDLDRDTFVGASTFAGNGTDTIYGYQAEDAISLGSALGAVFAALDLADDALANGSAWTALFAEGYVSYDGATGALSVDTDGTAGVLDTANTWFIVSGGAGAANGDTFTGETPPASAALSESVVILIGTYESATPLLP